MTEVARSRNGLRKIADPFVVATPGGVRTRTRVHLSASEESAVEQIGVHLGTLARQVLVSRTALGRVTSADQGRWRAEEKRRLTERSSSRWAGAITRTAIDSYHLGMRGLTAEVVSLRVATATIRARLEAPVGGMVTSPERLRARPVRGYANEGERFAKARRLAHLAHRLDKTAARLENGTPRIVVGGGRLWRNQHHLDQTQMTQEQWSQRWSDARMFLTADGESGKRYGNETLRLAPDGTLTIKVPTPLASTLGTHLTIAASASFATHRGEEWTDRISQHQAIRYDLHRDQRGRWYLDASWTYPNSPATPLATLQRRPTLGVDLNAGHVDVAVIDPSGNTIGALQRIDYRIDGATSRRDAQVRHVVTRILHVAEHAGCSSVSIENLDFTDARSAGRETMGRGRRGKRFRHTVAGLPTARFRDRLVAMAATAEVSVIAVDSAYTSQWGRQHWLPALKSSDPSVDGHRAAAVVIGRRSLGHRARRKPVGPLPRQRTRKGQPTRPASHGVRTSRLRVTAQPRAHDAAGPPDT